VPARIRRSANLLPQVFGSVVRSHRTPSDPLIGRIGREQGKRSAPSTGRNRCLQRVSTSGDTYTSSKWFTNVPAGSLNQLNGALVCIPREYEVPSAQPSLPPQTATCSGSVVHRQVPYNTSRTLLSEPGAVTIPVHTARGQDTEVSTVCPHGRPLWNRATPHFLRVFSRHVKCWIIPDSGPFDLFLFFAVMGRKRLLAFSNS
jgi:hypothetical protein